MSDENETPLEKRLKILEAVEKDLRRASRILERSEYRFEYLLRNNLQEHRDSFARGYAQHEMTFSALGMLDAMQLRLQEWIAFERGATAAQRGEFAPIRTSRRRKKK
jgi:hypothetical protein